MGETLLFQIGEAISGLRRARLMAGVTVTTVAIALAVLGGFLVLLRTTDHYLGQLRSTLKIVVFAKSTADSGSIAALRKSLDGDPAVESYTFVAKADALAQVQQELGAKAWVLKSLDSNPLPDSFEIKLNEGTDVQAFVGRCSALPAVDHLSQGQEWVDRVLKIVAVVRLVGLAVVLTLGLATLAIVASTIWLTVYARRDEIAVQKLVGATNWFIRTPYLLEGLMSGLAGALLASLVVVIGYKFVVVRVQDVIPGFVSPIGWGDLKHLSLQLHLMGGILGLLGSLLSLRRISV